MINMFFPLNLNQRFLSFLGGETYLIPYRRYLKCVYRQKGWEMKTREWDMLSQILQDKKARIMAIMRTCKSIDKLKNETG